MSSLDPPFSNEPPDDGHRFQDAPEEAPPVNSPDRETIVSTETASVAGNASLLLERVFWSVPG